MNRQGDVTSPLEQLTAAVCDRLKRNLRVRRTLPDGGRLRFDRQLPFLCVYRAPSGTADEGTRELVTSEAAYLFSSGDDQDREGLICLCRAISGIMREHFGVFLLIEIWADPDLDGPAIGRAAFRIVTAETETLPEAIGNLEAGLADIRLRNTQSHVELASSDEIAPPGMAPLMSAADRAEGGCFHIGLAVRPVYRDPQTGTLFPLVLQSLRRQLAAVLRQTVFAFSQSGTAAGRHYEALGPSSMVKAARLVDQQLCEVSESFDFLLQTTPVNGEAARHEFAQSDHAAEPTLHYRPLPYHPSELKRRLFSIPIHRIEDVTLSHLFSEKQDELDRQITAVKNVGTPAFLNDSLQLYGTAEADLVELATDILQRYGPTRRSSRKEVVHAPEIAAAAREEIDHYHQRLPDFHATVEIVDHIVSGLLVSRDRLFVADSAALRAERVGALLHHEIGTHLLTYFNGRQQPLRQLYAGLPGCDDLQEGLAVLAEYLGGGLTSGRLRTLAGRVLAVRTLTDGASFIDTFRCLHREYEFTERTAFHMTLRVHRAGGLTKDVVYLRGLRDLLAFLKKGHDVEPLYVGKIALKHVPFVQELRRRKIIQPPALLPRFWSGELQSRLDVCRELDILDLVESDR